MKLKRLEDYESNIIEVRQLFDQRTHEVIKAACDIIEDVYSDDRLGIEASEAVERIRALVEPQLEPGMLVRSLNDFSVVGKHEPKEWLRTVKPVPYTDIEDHGGIAFVKERE